MALGKRRSEAGVVLGGSQPVAGAGRHPFYSRLNEILERAKFDLYAERICRKYYATTMGRPSIAPDVYFRCFLVGYFEGIDSERGIAYGVGLSGLREFLGIGWEEQTPDHSTPVQDAAADEPGQRTSGVPWAL
ncbi:MAG: transposase [Bryobacterales bacterium]|nr:transposase [Bryobacterales bacterium]